MSTVHIDDRSSSMNRSQNKLLASLPFEEYQRIAPHLRSVPMKPKQVVQWQDTPIQDVYFPEAGAFSLVKTMHDGQLAEAALIGAEGAIGTGVFFGQRIAECDAVAQLHSRDVQVMGAEIFLREMENRGALYHRVIRYNQALMSQIIQTTICNSLHSVEQRCCRWLLMTRDRAEGDEFPLTHDVLAMTLSVRRPTVTLLIGSLQRAGAIDHGRGRMKIVDRTQLEAASCECYLAVKTQMRRLLPELGRLS